MRRGCAVIVGLALVAGSVGGAVAWATETSTASAAVQVATASLQPAQSVTATVNCPNRAKGNVTVAWTPSPSAFTGGYVVSRATGSGAPVQLATLPATATSYVDTTVTGSTTYTYTVTATYDSWTAAASAAPVTTAKRC